MHRTSPPGLSTATRPVGAVRASARRVWACGVLAATAMAAAPTAFAAGVPWSALQPVGSEPVGRGPVVVPMKRQGVLPVIEVLINGEGPFRIGVDSAGGGSLFLTPALVERLRLPRVAQANASDGSGQNPVALGVHQCATVSIGSLVVRDVAAAAGYRGSAGLGEPIDGVCGLPLFGDVLVTFDYPGGEFRFETGVLPEPDGLTILACEAGEPVPTVNLMVGDRVVRAHLDSRNVGSIDLRLSDLEAVRTKGAQTSLGQRSTQFNTFDIWGVRLDEVVRLGAYSFDEPYVLCSEPFEHANIGAMVLRQFVVTFDRAHHRVRLEHDGAAPLRVPLPRGVPAPEVDRLDGMVGEWVISGTVTPMRPGEQPLQIAGRATFERVYGDKFLHERFSIETARGPRPGEAFLGINVETEVYEYVQIDSQPTGVLAIAFGTRDAASGEITLEPMERPEVDGIPPVPPVRRVIRFEPDGSFVKTLYLRTTDGTWAKRSEYVYSRP